MIAGRMATRLRAAGWSKRTAPQTRVALARIEPMSADAPDAWARYVAEWTRGNHVRTAAGLGAAGILTVALGVG
jgi:uncharacterized membrane protein